MLQPMEGLRRREADVRLAEILLALASPNRLTLLRELREPRQITEVRLPPEDGSGRDAGGDERAIARQAVRAHLRKLLDVGAASFIATEDERSPRYLVNHQRLFEIAEEIRGLAQLRPLLEGPAMPTVVDARRESSGTEFPRLLLVRGLDEGRSFALPLARAPAAGWTIGRAREAHIRLDYDPFVSAENTRLRAETAGHTIEALEQGRNGTTINMRLLEPGRRRVLRHGDVVGVGRSLLVFHGKDPDAA